MVEQQNHCISLRNFNAHSLNRYSVASDPSQANNSSGDITLDLVLTLVDFRTPGGRRQSGLASSFLKGLEVGRKFRVTHKAVPVFARPVDLRRPMVLVANGSGVAPMRSIWQARYI